MRAIIRGWIRLNDHKLSEELLKPSQKRDCKKYIVGEIIEGDPEKIRRQQMISEQCVYIEELICKLLREKSWLPTAPQEENVVLDNQAKVCETIKSEHKEMVQRAIFATIFNGSSNSWGIVGRPTDFEIEFRIRQSIPGKLREVCEKLVSDIHGKVIEFRAQDPTGENAKERGSFYIDFDSSIEVLEPGSDHTAFHGKIIQNNRWKLAKENKQTETAIANVATLIAILSLIITIPIIADYWLPKDQAWHDWVKGILDRLSTSAIFAAITSWLIVLIQWRKLTSQKTIIKWEASAKMGE